MSECYLARCEQDRKFLRREFNKWTKNTLLQIGLETISKNHFEYDINLFNQTNDKQSPIDFNPNQSCLFCINRREYLTDKNPILSHDNTVAIIHNEENSPLDLSLKSPRNINSHPFFDIKSDIYNQDEPDLMNFNYSFPNVNLFSSLPTDPYQSFQDIHIAQLAKQMAYSRMIREIEHQRQNKKSKIPATSSLPSNHVNHLLNDIMIRMLNEVYDEQIKQQAKPSRKGELLFVKKQNYNNDDTTIFNTKKQHKHINTINPSLSSSSSTSTISSTCSSSIHRKNKTKSKSNYIPSRRSREIINNNNQIIGTDGKPIRPKRGQYRRYESGQLAKAVAAVLKNEMSVHKAGSYFGVPHSTLEYKVKERNVKISTTTKNQNESSSSISSMSINDNDNNHISRSKSIESDDHDESIFLSKDNNSNEDRYEKIQSFIPIEVEIN